MNSDSTVSSQTTTPVAADEAETDQANRNLQDQEEQTLATSATEADSNQPRIGLSALAGICLLLLLLLNGLIPIVHPVVDTLGNFQWQFVCLLFVLTLYQLIRKRLAWAIVLLLLTAIPAYNLSKFYVSYSTVEGGPVKIRMLSLNVLAQNNDYKAALDLIRERDPHIVTFAEYDEFWMKHVDGKLTAYPYRVGPREGNVIYSKIPMQALETPSRRFAPDPSFGCGGLAWIGDQQVFFWVVHTLSPTTPDRLRLRDAQIGSLRMPIKMQSFRKHVVIAGDFNATTHCQSLRQLIAQTSLIDSRLGRGIQNSWPTWCPPLAICIDHVFTSELVRVHDRRVERSVGSDHRPIYVELSFGRHRLTKSIERKHVFESNIRSRFAD